jgi:cellulose synthase operon protein C
LAAWMIAWSLWWVCSTPGEPPRTSSRGLYEQAAAALASDDAATAVMALEELLERFPDDRLAPLAAAQLGEHYVRQRQFARAAELLRAWQPKIEQSELTQRLAPQASARALLHLATALEQSGNAAAAPQFWQLLLDHPSSTSALRVAARFKLAQAYQDQQQIARAIEVLEGCDLEQLGAEDALRWRVLRARLGLAAATPEVTLQSLDGIVTANLPSADAYAVAYLRSEAALATRQYPLADACLVELEQLMHTASTDATADTIAAGRAAIALRRCEVALLQRHTARAQELAMQSHAAYPDFHALYEFDIILGRAAIARAELAQAREYFRRAAEQPGAIASGSAARALWLIGETYFLAHDVPAAATAYTVVLERFPATDWSAAALLQRGKCHELQQDQVAAVADYRELVAKYPDSSWQQPASARLAELNAQEQTTRLPPTSATR